VVEVVPFDRSLPPIIQLRGYQQRWVNDRARFKFGVKSARIGFSFGTGIEAILDCLEVPATTWTILSAGKANSNEFVDLAGRNVQAIGAVAQFTEDPWGDNLGQSDVMVQQIRFANRSRIMALPANPRTARGYPGNAVLDEFAHHEHSYAIWAAITRQVALGHKLRALSTPNGEGGKFYDLAKEMELADGVATEPNPRFFKGWSTHWVDVNLAMADGCPINMQEMRALIRDEDIVNQEFYCQFLKNTGAWLPLELIQQCEDPDATMVLPPGFKGRGQMFGGLDVARDHDQTSFWLKERIGDVLWTRMVLHLFSMPLTEQARTLRPYIAMAARTAIDSTGMGIGLFDILNEAHPGKIMGVNFAGSSRIRDEKREQKQSAKSSSEDGAVKLKIDLAIRIKRAMQDAKERIPYDLDVRKQLMQVKREATATGVTFDAPRIEIETGVAGGKKLRAFAHADDFWGCALATYAASGAVVTLDIEVPDRETTAYQTRGLL
jgi:phage FluMu gp28-like protein